MVFAKIVPFELFPYDDVDVIYVVAELPDGHSLEQTSDKMREVENIVDQISRDVLVNHTTTIGHHDRDVYGVTAGLRNNWGMMTLYLKPAQYRDTSSKKIMEDLEKKLGTLKGFEKLELDKFNDGPPVGRPITITYVSSEDALRRRYAKETFEFLKKMPGVLNVDQDEKMGKEELLLVPDYPKMAELGVTSRDLAETIRAAYNGVVATEITREGEEIDFRVQLTPEMRRRTDVLKDLPIMNPQGRLIKIGSFTKMLPSKGYEAVRHYNGKRSITVTADVDPAITTGDAVNTAIRDEFLQRIEKEPGIRMIFGGAEKESQESIANFGVALIWSLIIIYFILVMLFNSFVQPLIIVAIVPFGLAGVAYTFFTFGMPISFLCIIGTLGLIGVMVNDSLVMVSHLNNLRLENNGLDLSVLIEGCQDRLRPVILTTITTMMGLTPTILGIGGYEPFIVPLVLALAGGLFFATPITLVLVPILYSFGVRKVQA
ncbi:MAG: efflux RND transporter permease subunit [Deltaproteobacteria bacterium]|nr:efflux RND transporter permease subunit [Deltaproteobacteria bacterium]